MRNVSKKQAIIKRKLSEVYSEIDNEREPVCQGCDRGSRPLSHSHTIGQKRCKQLGKTELIWDKDNIEIECFGNRDFCHEKWEKGTIKQKRKMKNFERKLEYVKKHDPEGYIKLTLD